MKALPIRRRWLVLLTGAAIAGAAVGGCLLIRLRSAATVLPAESIQVGDTVREYRLVIPPVSDERSRAPVLFVFHGAIDTTEQAAEYTQLDRLAASQGVYVVYPQGHFLSWPPNIPPENPDIIEPDLAFFDALCRELTRRYPVDAKRVYVTGMSQGAAFVNLLVAKRSEKIAAAASHSGWLPDPLGDEPMHTRHKCPLLFIAGSEDLQVSPAAVREACDCFRREGHPVELLEIDGLGHQWALEHNINAKIWQFLSPHRLPEQVPPSNSRHHSSACGGIPQGSRNVPSIGLFPWKSHRFAQASLSCLKSCPVFRHKAARAHCRVFWLTLAIAKPMRVIPALSLVRRDHPSMDWLLVMPA